MNITPKINIKPDNSISSGFYDNIIISSRKFAPSAISDNEIIAEGYSSLEELIETYGSLNNFFLNIYNRDKKYTLILDRYNYVIFFISYMKSIFTYIDPSLLYIIYRLLINQEKINSFLLQSEYNLNVMDKFNNRNQFELYLNDPMPKEEFNNLIDNCNPVPFFSELSILNIPFEFKLMKYFSGGYKDLFEYGLSNQIERCVLDSLVKELQSLRKRYYQYIFPYNHIGYDKVEEDVLDRTKDPDYTLLDPDLGKFDLDKEGINGYTLDRLVDVMSFLYSQMDMYNIKEVAEYIKREDYIGLINNHLSFLINIFTDRSPMGISFNKLLLLYIERKKDEQDFFELYAIRD
nr:MAG TPA: hypothetical protein [Caudoviricetes sp.]